MPAGHHTRTPPGPQVGATNAGLSRALRAAMAAATDLSCYEYKVAPKDKMGPSQRELHMAAARGGQASDDALQGARGNRTPHSLHLATCTACAMRSHG